jgi:hypothetical protein
MASGDLRLSVGFGFDLQNSLPMADATRQSRLIAKPSHEGAGAVIKAMSPADAKTAMYGLMPIRG